MNTTVKLLLFVALAAAIVAVVLLKPTDPVDSTQGPPRQDAAGPNEPAFRASGSVPAALPPSTPASAALPRDVLPDDPADPRSLPRLVDLGADQCIPCKMMAPVLQELKTEYAGRLEVEFIDVWKHPDAGKAYRITLIPTQIFYDADGAERFRHVGFMAKDDILAKWRELGIRLE